LPAKILVVEDHSDSREMLTTILEGEGFSIISAQDGQAGLDMVKSERPDLIITDLNMPDMDGVEMIARLRAEPEFFNIPVLVLSGRGVGLSQDAVRAGADVAIHKPIEVASFLRLVKNLLNYVSSIGLLVYAGISAGAL
jgi:CheY-like chemotaxis protein